MRRILYAFFAFLALGLLFSGGRKMFAQGGQPRSMVTRAVDESQRISLHGNVHPFATAQNDQGAVASTMQIAHILLVLKRTPEQEAALENLIAQQADKSSPNYQKWLTPAQFGEQFGASDQDITAVTTWLGSHGFQVNGVANGRDMIDFSGTAGEIQEAFHTEIHNYLVDGKTHFANVSDPQIPAALAPIVAGVNRLNSFRPKPMVHQFGAIKMDVKTHRVTSVTPNLTITGLGANGCYGNNTNCYAVTPFDFATIYDLNPLWQASFTGTGVNIAIVSDSDVNTADLTQFRSLMGLPAFASGQFQQIQTTSTDPGLQNCSLDTDEQEAVLDVEWAGGVAPGATIHLVVAPSAGSCGNPSTGGETGLPTGDTFGGDYAAYYAINTLNDPILTDSYGECELGLGSSGNAFYNTLWQQANTQGITVVTATGDTGSAGCDNPTASAQEGLQVNGAASTPYDVAVGGTDFNYTSASGAANFWNASNTASPSNSTLSAKGAIPEVVYNDSCTNPLIASLLGIGGNSAFNTCNSTQAAGASVNTIVAVGSSGGFSNCTAPTGLAATDCSGGYGKPTWQTGTASDSHRDIPDLSLFAGDGTVSGTFYVVCEEDAFISSGTQPTACALQGTTAFFAADGGTSVSAQAMGGIVAILDQYHGKRYGSVAFNTQLYTLAGAQTASSCNASGNSVPTTCIFRDITSGTNSVPCITATTNCGSTISSFVAPAARPWIEFRWAPMGIGLLLCALCAAIFVAMMPPGRRRWSSAFALLLFGAMFGVVSCGGGGNSNGGGGGTVTPGGGNGVGVLSGYNAGAGYDRATGLGTIDVNLLIKANGW